MSDFVSITIALEAWFHKPLVDLPEELQQRVTNAFLASWDALSPTQRREAALTIDLQRDPTCEKANQFWWDFYQKQNALKDQIASWENANTPSATDMAKKEAMLNELGDALQRMEQFEKVHQRPYSPEPFASSKPSYIEYPKAFQLLAVRLKATPEELAAWIFLGPENGGLQAYTNANELDPPNKFYYGYFMGSQDYIAPLMACWFSESDIDHFQPADRFITGKELLIRWGKFPTINPRAFICAKVAESRLQDIHPIYGVTRVSFFDREDLPDLETGLFALSKIQEIEKANGISPKASKSESLQNDLSDERPWWIVRPDDPSPKYNWFTPARFFARQLVAEDPTLLSKREILANKVAKSMQQVGIYKRGGKLPFDPGTIKKALSNVKLK